MRLTDQIIVLPTAAEMARFNDWYDKRATESATGSGLSADLKLCINEVVANLMSYGMAKTTNPLVMISVDLQAGSASALIKDNGTFFDIRGWETLQERDLYVGEPGGFGISLIRERATSIRYARNGDWNELRIECRGAGS